MALFFGSGSERIMALDCTFHKATILNHCSKPNAKDDEGDDGGDDGDEEIEQTTGGSNIYSLFSPRSTHNLTAPEINILV